MNRLLRCATVRQGQVSHVSVKSTYTCTRLLSPWGNHEVASGSRRRTNSTLSTATATFWPLTTSRTLTTGTTSTLLFPLFDSTMSLSVATNTPAGAASSLVQTRTMAKKSGNWSGDRYSNSNNNNNTRSGGVPPPKQNQNQGNQNQNTLRLQMCWTPYDLEQVDYDDEDGNGGGNGDDEDDEYLFVKSKFDLRDVKQKAKDMFDSNDDLEYHDGNEWKPLKDINVLSKYRGGKEPVPIRVPEVYDEEGYDDDDDREDDYEHDDDFNEEDYEDEDDDEDDDDDDDKASAGSPATTEMKDMIRDLAVVLVESGYTRGALTGKALTLMDSSSNTEMATTAWILQQLKTTSTSSALTTMDADDSTGALKTSSGDAESLSDRLEHVLLGHVGALNHIAQCLDYDFVWEAAKLQKQVESIVNDRSASANAQTQTDN